MGDVTQIINAIQRGERRPTEELLPLVYNELRSLAARQLAREKPGQTIQATELVHEAYLRLVGSSQPQNWQGRRHFFGAAAKAMRRILVDRARRKQRVKHGGNLERIDFEEIQIPIATPDEEFLALDEALEELARLDARAAELVNLRYFAGLTCEQAAGMLGISRRTTDNIWNFAQAWLCRRIREEIG